LCQGLNPGTRVYNFVILVLDPNSTSCVYSPVHATVLFHTEVPLQGETVHAQY